MSENKTRVWLGGMEVQFVKWTPNAMIYTRYGSQETMAHLPRSTVQRLLRENMLRIEGDCPDWATLEESPE